MQNIKPIETVYKGYRFRSRLEAKWAVYFDLIGIEYQYEHQGFVLDKKINYLPDFFLPGIDAYVEIKPKGINHKDLDEAKDKIEYIAYWGNKYGLFCIGDPMDNDIHIYGYMNSSDGVGLQWKEAEFIFQAVLPDDDFITHRTVFDVGLVVGDRGDKGLYHVSKPDGTDMITVLPFNALSGFHRLPYAEQQLARQKRFEYGERG